jgi:hypothetical protein
MLQREDPAPAGKKLIQQDLFLSSLPIFLLTREERKNPSKFAYFSACDIKSPETRAVFNVIYNQRG